MIWLTVLRELQGDWGTLEIADAQEIWLYQSMSFSQLLRWSFNQHRPIECSSVAKLHFYESAAPGCLHLKNNQVNSSEFLQKEGSHFFEKFWITFWWHMGPTTSSPWLMSAYSTTPSMPIRTHLSTLRPSALKPHKASQLPRAQSHRNTFWGCSTVILTNLTYLLTEE